jgi:hypothetical protein
MATAVAPGLFKKATDIVMNRTVHSREEHTNRLRKLLLVYSTWNAKWKIELFAETHATQNGPPDDINTTQRLELFAIYLAYLILTHRFISALDPHVLLDSERAALAAAQRVVKLADSFQLHTVIPLRVKLALRIAGSVQSTSHQWLQPPMQHSSDPPRSITPQVFRHWCVILHRSSGEPQTCLELAYPDDD